MDYGSVLYTSLFEWPNAVMSLLKRILLICGLLINIALKFDVIRA